MITRELLVKFLDGQCTKEELALLKAYLTSGSVAELDQILEEDWASTSDVGFGGGIEEYRRRIWIRLEDELGEVRSALFSMEGSSRKRLKSLRAWAAAAVVLLAFSGYWVFRKGKAPEYLVNRSSATLVEKRSNQDASLEILLPDGSCVVLDPGSKLSYPERFDRGERSVRLEGKAFFDVAKDSLNPFFVKTNSINVKVLGTSFSVSSFDNKPTEVSVVTGKVAVFVPERTGSVILEPNERAVRLNGNAKLAKLLVEEPVMIRREAILNLFDFDETPVSDVFAALEKAYDIHIRFDAGKLKHCTLRARLDDQPLFVKLDMICGSLGLEYEIVGTDIAIKGQGCYEGSQIKNQ